MDQLRLALFAEVVAAVLLARHSRVEMLAATAALAPEASVLSLALVEVAAPAKKHPFALAVVLAVRYQPVEALVVMAALVVAEASDTQAVDTVVVVDTAAEDSTAVVKMAAADSVDN